MTVNSLMIILGLLLGVTFAGVFAISRYLRGIGKKMDEIVNILKTRER